MNDRRCKERRQRGAEGQREGSKKADHSNIRGAAKKKEVLEVGG
jgi:hypothetical protein